jgi:redox-sensitive bicupin YhaK (pirin superfamily)
MLKLTHVIEAEKHFMGGKPMLQPLPTSEIDHLDPFLLVHHHGPNTFSPGSTGLEIGPHPHRGIETVTFVLQGDITHVDNLGNTGSVSQGGVQWMTAGQGIMHDEGTSESFNNQGGTLEIIQLWLNLPAKHKGAEPFYGGWQTNEIPTQEADGGRATLKLVSGSWNSEHGAHKPLTDVHLALVELAQDGVIEVEIPAGVEILFYTYRGSVKGQDQAIVKGSLARFDHAGGTLGIHGLQEDNRVLLGYATPFAEPIVAHGPFVMNTEAEIKQAFEDFRRGRFGGWPVG